MREVPDQRGGVSRGRGPAASPALTGRRQYAARAGVGRLPPRTRPLSCRLRLPCHLPVAALMLSPTLALLAAATLLAPDVTGGEHGRGAPPRLTAPLPTTQLLVNADFSQAGHTPRSPAAEWLTEGTAGYSLVPGVRHGSSGGSIRAGANSISTIAGAVQVFRVPPHPGEAGGGRRLLRVSRSMAAGVAGTTDENYAISCDLAFSDGTHHYGVAIAPFATGCV